MNVGAGTTDLAQDTKSGQEVNRGQDITTDKILKLSGEKNHTAHQDFSTDGPSDHCNLREDKNAESKSSKVLLFPTNPQARASPRSNLELVTKYLYESIIYHLSVKESLCCRVGVRAAYSWPISISILSTINCFHHMDMEIRNHSH